ncbi:putative N-acetyl neuramic acid synthetase NeuB [Methylophilales bacterium HTCC2181]|uniref:Putative N-acetyl neuramic acid synthetase NeuB n=1 Tax=Methylophilales bacterium HTCC2181 TaxID=383631 RepID=A0P7B2_9PROT|nr:putative N-acetyl neuramic acid synthetase NeuB [Methylophilales bacterium HTCC2181]
MNQNINSKPIFIIAEIGINHGGDFSIALELIKAAAQAKVNGIKFQYRNLDNAYADGAKQIGDEMLLKEITKNYLSPEVILRLVDDAHSLDIEAGISFFDEADIADFGDGIHHFDFFKSPSVELNNAPLINKMLGFDKPVYVSLGCHHEDQIDDAFMALDKNNWIALHCVSNYPVSLSNAHLGYLSHMREKWQRPYGYSSHDEDWEVCLIAMSMGATVIERHITFDKNADGLDHTTSSTPEEFAKIATFSENMQLLMTGNFNRVPNQGEMLNFQNLGRSYYAKGNILKGDIVSFQDLSFRSPRVGFGRADMVKYLGKPALKNIGVGEVISESVFLKSEQVSDSALSFARENKISIPVRLHDLNDFENKFPIGAYEFHLSFKEVLNGFNRNTFKSNNRYSIHLPDYISSTKLMDPFSDDKSQAQGSLDILQRTVDFAKLLQDKIGMQVPIVGSFSVVHKSVAEFYEEYTNLLSSFRNQGILILPQWLPPIAWYFGGSVKLDVMNELKDVAYIDQHELPICMDICHLCMGDSLFDFDAPNIVDLLSPRIEHLHIADAAGIDGEGLQFGEGDAKNMKTLKKAFDFDCMKVIEVWQGHLDGGAGFSKAISNLERLFNNEK